MRGRYYEQGYPYFHTGVNATYPFTRVEEYLGEEGSEYETIQYRYLNSGLFAGYAWALKRALERLTSNAFRNQYVLHTPFATSPEEAEPTPATHTVKTQLKA